MLHCSQRNIAIDLTMEIDRCFQKHCRRYGVGRSAFLLTADCAPIFSLLKHFFETSRNDKTTDNDEKRNKNIQFYLLE